MQAYELRLLDESTGEYKALAFIQGADGKDAFTAAQAAGYTGTEADFYAALANIPAGLERLDYLWTAVSIQAKRKKPYGTRRQTKYGLSW